MITTDLIPPPHSQTESLPTSHTVLKFLAFKLGEEEYGIDILKVQEIRGYDAITSTANTPDYIKGVVNLRGTIVPILDIRIKFKLSKVTYDQLTGVVILNIGSKLIGMVVDSVSYVITLSDKQIMPVPDMDDAVTSEYLIGLATLDESMIMLIDITKLMSTVHFGTEDALAANFLY